MMNNRGQGLIGLVSVIGIIFAIVITIIIAKTIFTSFSDNTDVFDESNESLGIIATFKDSGYQSFDNMFMGIFIGTLIVLSITAFLTKEHPAFFPVSAFIILPIVILISAIISNVFEQFIGADTLLTAANDGAIAANIMLNLPFYMFGFGVLLLIVTFGINKVEGI